jgi:BMFP domain-containing protein YqiC
MHKELRGALLSCYSSNNGELIMKLADTLKQALSNLDLASARKALDSQVLSGLKTVGVATNKEVAELKAKLAKLEAQLAELSGSKKKAEKAAASEAAAPKSDTASA